MADNLIQYRYFTTDLLTNQVLAEIPFKSVSYERALKAAGGFSGSVPVISETDTYDLYDSTMPGNTGLYVVRDGVCVWGGIIWSRSYNVITRTLSVTANEFPSYFQHRKIWKTWAHDFEASLEVANNICTGTLALGSTYEFAVGSKVKIDFVDAQAVSGFYYEITSFNSNNDTYTFTTSSTSEPNASGTTYTIPNGDYQVAQVTVRVDTYDYFRSLVSAVASDFSGISFANDEINPELQIEDYIVSKSKTNNIVTLAVSDTHELIPGQEILVQNVGPEFDGLHSVIDVTPSTFTYSAPGANVAVGAVANSTVIINTASAIQASATLTTNVAHNFYDGQVLSISGVDQTGSQVFDVASVIDVTSNTAFKYSVGTPSEYPTINLVPGTATVGNNIQYVVVRDVYSNDITLTTADPHGFSVGNSVNVTNIFNTAEVTFREVNNGKITYTTSGAHGFTTNNQVIVSGILDFSNVISKSLTVTSPGVGNLTVSTSVPHGLAVGSALTVAEMYDTYAVSNYSYNKTSDTLTITTTTDHNMGPDAQAVFTLNGIPILTYPVANVAVTNGIVNLSISSVGHNIRDNDSITVTGYPSTSGAKQFNSIVREDYITTVVMAVAHGIPQSLFDARRVTATIDVTNNSAIPNEPPSFDRSSFERDNVVCSYLTPTAFTFTSFQGAQTTNPYTNNASGLGTVVFGGAVGGGINGTHKVSDVSANTVTFIPTEAVSDVAAVVIAGMTVQQDVNPLNKSYTGIASVTANTVSVVFDDFENDITTTSAPSASINTTSIFNLSAATVTAVPSSTSITYSKSAEGVRANVSATASTSGQVTVLSPVMNGTFTINAVPATNAFIVNTNSTSAVGYGKASPSSVAKSLADVTGNNLTITAVNVTAKTFTYSKLANNFIRANVSGYATAVSTPRVIYGTYGGFTSNSDVGNFGFSTSGYSGNNVNAADFLYRGFSLTNVGEALDKYSDGLTGFDYRIDCGINPDTGVFTRTFVLIPIDTIAANPPEPGQPASIQAFGADEFVFEFPGNISDIQLEESAENSATRFFMVGSLEGGGSDPSQPYAVASAKDLLYPTKRGQRAWPLLDEDANDGSIYDETTLYSYAERYLKENRPPDGRISVSVNGSVEPIVGTYYPGDWCSLVINDSFFQLRLSSDLEPRDDVLVRKIESYSVSVPDSITFPEKVTLNLLADWQVDRIGES
jgi:hypothetical protein